MTSEILDIQPRELKFVFELKKQSSCSIRLANKTSQYVAFKVKTTSPKKYCVRPNVGIVKPNSSSDFTVTMQAQRIAPPDMQCKDKFLIQSTVVPFGTAEDDITSNMFAKDCGKYIEEKKLKVVLVSPPQSPVLAPLNGELRQEYRSLASVQKDMIPSGPPSNGGLKQDSFEAISVPGDAAPIDVALKNHRASSEIRFNHQVKEYSLNEASVQDDGALLGSSDDKQFAQNLCYDNSIINDRVPSGLKINEQLKIFPSNGDSVVEDGEQTGRFSDKEFKQALHHELEDKDSVASDSPVHEELKRAPLNNISEENGKLLNEAPKHEELKQDSSSKLLLQEVTESQSISPSIMVAENKDTDESRTDKYVEPTTVEKLDEPTAEDLGGLDLTRDCEDLKSKLTVMESKLKEAELAILKLTEERRMTAHQKDKFKLELENLRKNYVTKIQVGFPFLFVCMVALVSLVAGYYIHP